MDKDIDILEILAQLDPVPFVWIGFIGCVLMCVAIVISWGIRAREEEKFYVEYYARRARERQRQAFQAKEELEAYSFRRADVARRYELVWVASSVVFGSMLAVLGFRIHRKASR